MVSFKALLATCVAVSGVFAAPGEMPGDDISKRQSSTPSGEGYSNGFFYSWWSDGASPAQYTNQAGGRYTVNWQSGGNLVGGKGWNPGGRRNVIYSGRWTPVNNGNAYLTVYGWTRNPLVEYYIVENYGEYNPGSSATPKGTVTSNGGTYDLYMSTRYNAPSIDGTKTFNQYWAIRREKRTGGTVSTGTFFDAWAKAGMQLGNHYYMVMATEAYRSAGSSDITVS